VGKRIGHGTGVTDGTEKTAVLSSPYFSFTYQFLRVVLRKKAAADRPEKAAADRPPCSLVET
jgi:hypothetical protein